MTAEQSLPATAGGARRVRHALVDRLFHWFSAGAVVVLLATALLPILGIEFAWVAIHWVTGLILAVLVILHVVRAVFWQNLRSMWISFGDIRDGLAALRSALRMSPGAGRLAGKYSLAQKAIHHAFTVVVLTAIGTGLMMLVKIDTPWWERDPYWVSDDVWAIVYVLHDLTSLCLVTMIIMHVYFAFRPEKLHLLRSMILGWITDGEYDRYYGRSDWHARADRRSADAPTYKHE
ncbi:MAG: cytochrome b/b6 domain-containing protein [Gammaproteobacteria bacterium]|nr:cytochrome b/b6 domain-containing protein [Gammaproteobacteria bacterium]